MSIGEVFRRIITPQRVGPPVQAVGSGMLQREADVKVYGPTDAETIAGAVANTANTAPPGVGAPQPVIVTETEGFEGDLSVWTK